MGCSPGDSECYDNEKPAHEVTITKGFWMGQTPVTQAAYQRVTGSNPSSIKVDQPPAGSLEWKLPTFKLDQLPVESLEWKQAASYCSTVGGRLPTEAEWEYAARGGTTGSQYGALDALAWYRANSGGWTHQVGLKQANAYGLYDMLGNVWQWAGDWYGGYSPVPARDPQGPSNGQYRTLRGGSFNADPRVVRASFRHWSVPDNRNLLTGFRCVVE
jgi:formylglycine-generating enzyme required for sulfatase activity